MRASNRRRQSGVALLTAIILVALATILAVAIAFRTAMTARRGASSFTVEQGLQFGSGAEAIAAYALVEDAKPRAGQQLTDSEADQWTAGFAPTEVAPDVTFEALLTDESGKFNLNTLVNPDGTTDADSVQLFEALLSQLGIETKWASMMADWIDADPAQNSSGAEDSVYTALRPPYRTPGMPSASAPITSVSELMALNGFSRENYLKLLPHVTALPPEQYKINVCFASAILIDAIESNFNQSVMQTYSKMDPDVFASTRKSQCGALPGIIKADISNPKGKTDVEFRLASQSEYFRLHTWVTIGTTRFALYSLMERKAKPVRVVSRTFGTE